MLLSLDLSYCIVFTPLFLGASLYVPSADDIGTPGRLAEWMDHVQATVTHLTPGKPTALLG